MSLGASDSPRTEPLPQMGEPSWVRLGDGGGSDRGDRRLELAEGRYIWLSCSVPRQSGFIQRSF